MQAKLYLHYLNQEGLRIDRVHFIDGALRIRKDGGIIPGVRQLKRVEQDGRVIQQVLLFPDDSLAVYDEQTEPKFAIGMYDYDDQ